MRKALDESDDNPSTNYNYAVDTTKSLTIPTKPSTTTVATTTSTSTTSTPPSTTTTTSPSTTTTTTTTTESTTRSTTSRSTTKRSFSLWKNSDDVPKTPKTYFSNSFSHHYNSPNQNNQIGQTNAKSPFKIVTKRPSGALDSSTTTFLTTPTINPFYYGFNRLPRFSTTQSTSLKTTLQSQQQHLYTQSTRNPFYFNHTTKKPDLLAFTSTTLATNNEVDNNYQSENPRSDEIRLQTEKPKSSSTYNPVFDIYFKQIARQRTATP